VAAGVTDEDLGPARVGHVVDYYHRYPGETVAFFTRVDVREPLSDLTLRITLPKGLQLGDYRPPHQRPYRMPYVEVEGDTSYLVWSLDGEVPAGEQYNYYAEAKILPTYWNLDIESRAALTTKDHTILSRETATFKVWAKGKYLRFLPELFEQDEFIGRFLMLFESFWAPVETQIEVTHHYLDPRLTPSRFLPWLASWLDLELDESWPEERLRRLIRWAIALHRSRGTKWGLLKYLEIYTGQKAALHEQRARNFELGPGARLGPGVALGTGNVPHTFTVSLRLPPMEAETEQERERLEKVRKGTIESIINLQKPAHTIYALDLEIVSPEDLAAEAAAEAEAEAETPEEEKDEIAAQAAIWFKLDDDESSRKAEPKKGNASKRKKRGDKS
jgi:phage tail-like protein